MNTVRMLNQTNQLNKEEWTDQDLRSLTYDYFYGRVKNEEISEKYAKDTMIPVIEFFNKFYGVKDVLDITINTLKSANKRQGEEYKKFLLDKGNSFSYMGKQIKSLRRYYNYLINETVEDNLKDPLINNNPFKSIKTTPTKAQEKTLPNKTEWGGITREELVKLIKITTMKDMSLIYEILGNTAIRVNNIINLNIDKDFIKIKGMMCIHVWDKTRWVTEGISDAIYNDLIELSETNNTEPGKIFRISLKTAQRHFKKDCISIGINEQEFGKECRNLSLHSLKKAAVKMALDATNGNLEAGRSKGHWSDVQMIEKYNKQEYDPTKDVSNLFNLRGTDLDKEFKNALNQMDKYDLITLLMSSTEQVKEQVKGSYYYKKALYDYNEKAI